jgi:antirestriction protein ArdC
VAKTNDRIDLYTDVTNRIIAELEKGPAQWVKSWTCSPDSWRPINHSTDRAYRGVNVLLLAFVCAARGYPVNRWLTFRQALTLGGAVRKGAKGVRVTFWKQMRADAAEGAEAPALDSAESERGLRMVLRHFTVFNVADVDGLCETTSSPPCDLSLPAQIVRASGARIVPGSPCYRPDEDVIALPGRQSFATEEDYFVTAFHELVHWTAPRVGREVNAKRFGDDAYAVEELVAELGAAMLCGVCNLPTLMQSASYLDHWLRVLRQDKRAIFAVASAAQRGADYLLEASGDGASTKAAE